MRHARLSMPSRSCPVWNCDVTTTRVRPPPRSSELRRVDGDVPRHAVPLERLHHALRRGHFAQSGPRSPREALGAVLDEAPVPAALAPRAARCRARCRGPTTGRLAPARCTRSHTSSRGASKMRSMRISRGAGVVTIISPTGSGSGFLKGVLMIKILSASPGSHPAGLDGLIPRDQPCPGKQSREAEADGAEYTVCPEATMDADLDTLCTVVYCTADDLLPEARRNARRRRQRRRAGHPLVAQAIMGIPSDRRFLAVARKRLVHLFPRLPSQPAYWKRRRRLADAIEWLMAHFAEQSPGCARRPAALSTRPRCDCAAAARRPSARRSARPPATATAPPIRAGSGAFVCTLLAAPDGTPRALHACASRPRRA